MYPARCPNPSCGYGFESDHSGSVTCPACGTVALVVLDVAATVDPTPPAPFLEDELPPPGGRAPAQPGLASTLVGSGTTDTAHAAPGLTGVIGRFRVRSKLGSGAFGDVYRAHDPQLDREVALKVAKPGALDSPERVGRFLREARAAANLQHPHIVPVFNSGCDGDRHSIATKFVNGRTFEAEIEDAEGNPLTSIARRLRNGPPELARCDHGRGDRPAAVPARVAPGALAQSPGLGGDGVR